MTERKPGPYQNLRAEGTYRVEADIPTIPFNKSANAASADMTGMRRPAGRPCTPGIFFLPGMLYAKVLGSPHAHAKIIRLDTSQAEAYPGVRAVLRYDDPEIKGRELTGSIAGPKRMSPDTAGWAMKPVKTILGDEAFFEGQMVGVAVCADTEQTAAEALQRVKIRMGATAFRPGSGRGPEAGRSGSDPGGRQQ